MPSYLPATRYGGPIQSVHGLCKSLVRRGHHVEVFTTAIDGDRDSAVPCGQPVDIDGVQVTYHRGAWPRRLFAARGLRAACNHRVREFDLVHIHSMYLLPTFHAARACRRHGVPYLIAPRGMLDLELIRARSPWIKRAWIRLFDRRNIEAASAVHLTSEQERVTLEAFHFALRRVLILPNGIDVSEQDEPLSANAFHRYQPYGLFLGRLSWKKGLDVLISAWSKVHGLNLLIAGIDDEGRLERLQKQTNELGLGQRICFIGPLTGEKKQEALRGAELFVLPSRSENFGVAVLEAMAEGCPVIVSPGVGLASVIRSEACGIVVEAEAPALARAVSDLHVDGRRRRAMGERAAAVARRQFDWTVIAEATEQAYQQVIAESLHPALAT